MFEAVPARGNLTRGAPMLPGTELPLSRLLGEGPLADLIAFKVAGCGMSWPTSKAQNRGRGRRAERRWAVPLIRMTWGCSNDAR